MTPTTRENLLFRTARFQPSDEERRRLRDAIRETFARREHDGVSVHGTFTPDGCAVIWKEAHL